ncbi:sugar ABC transporter permease, partial [Pseudomonas sp. FW305-BF6]
LTQFMAPWMDFILPRLLISSNEKKTLAIGLFELIKGQTNQNFTMFAAGAVLVAVPITILYVWLQKYIIQGVTAGANKG